MTVREKWRAPESGERYEGARWSSAGKRGRDPRLVSALLARHLRGRGGLVLDAPCGTGRLGAALASFGRTYGVDVSPSMLREARASGVRALVLGDVEHLPFRDGAFDAVVCCRLLHHLDERAQLARVLAELVRVSRELVVASFWDAHSLPAWRRALLPSRRAPRRFARPRAELVELLEGAGAEVVGWKHSLRFVSRQAFVVARKCARP